MDVPLSSSSHNLIYGSLSSLQTKFVASSFSGTSKIECESLLFAADLHSGSTVVVFLWLT